MSKINHGNFIECLPVGCPVFIGPPASPIEGDITAVTVRPGSSVTYEVTWFHGGELKTAWLHDTQVRPRSDKRLTIGFSVRDK